jgi:hypothetical protein
MTDFRIRNRNPDVQSGTATPTPGSVVAASISNSGSDQQAIIQKLGIWMVNAAAFGALGDGSSNNVAAYNAAHIYAASNNIGIVYWQAGSDEKVYVFASKPNAQGENVQDVSDSSETCVFEQRYDSGSSTETFIDASNGGGITGIKLRIGNGFTAGRLVVVAPSTTLGFHKFNDLNLTYTGTGTISGTAMVLDGSHAGATAGLRDIFLTNVMAFGDILVDSVVNLFGYGLYCTNLTTQCTSPNITQSTDLRMDFIAISGDVNISDSFACLIDAAYFDGSETITIDNNSSGLMRIAQGFTAAILTNGSTDFAVLAQATLFPVPVAYTPVLSGSSTAGTQTYNTQVGYYTLTGKRVDFSARIILTAFDVATAGNIRVSIPSACANLASMSYAVAVSLSGGIDYTTNYTTLEARIAPNTAFVELRQAGDNQVSIAAAAANMTNSAAVLLTGWYWIP